MPYPRFLAFNAAGGSVWAVVVVLLGYFAGASYPKVQAYLGRASAVLLALLVVLGAAVLLARYLARHPAQVQGLLHRIRAARPVQAVERVVARGVETLASRAGDAPAFSLAAVSALVLVSVLGIAFSAVLDNVLDGGGITVLDHPVLQWLVTHRDDEMTAFMRVVTALGGPVVLPIVALGGILVTRLRTHTWSYAALIGITAVGSTLITVAAKTIVGRSRPPLESAIATENGYAFPSGHSLNSLAIYGVLALVAILATTAWSRRVWVAVSAATLVTLVGLSRLYLGVHWLTDVLGAWTLGGAWLTAVTFVWWYTVRPRGLSGGHPGQWKTDTEDRAGSGAAAPTGAHALPPHGIIAHNPGSPGLEWPTARRRQR